jgi:chemotaxis response regulator CheB
MAGAPVGVVAVDDLSSSRAVLCDVIAAADELVVVGEADSGESAVSLVLELEPDVVLMDVRMPGMGGIAASRSIKKMRPSTVVVLVSSTHPSALPSPDESGADELIWKNDLRPKLLAEVWRRSSTHDSEQG